MLLRRDISAITAPFKKAWAEYTKKRSPSRSHPIGRRVTPERFRDMLAAFGIYGTKKLAEIIGTKQRRAQQIMGDPSKLTTEHQRKLTAWAEAQIADQSQYVSELDSEADSIASDLSMRPEDEPRYKEIAAEYDSVLIELDGEKGELDRMHRELALLSGNRYRDDAERAARLEFQARALLEMFRILKDDDRLSTLSDIASRLSRYRSREARSILAAMNRTSDGDEVRLGDLADLIAGGEYADQLESSDPDIFEYEVLNEYAGGGK